MLSKSNLGSLWHIWGFFVLVQYINVDQKLHQAFLFYDTVQLHFYIIPNNSQTILCNDLFSVSSRTVITLPFLPVFVGQSACPDSNVVF